MDIPLIIISNALIIIGGFITFFSEIQKDRKEDAPRLDDRVDAEKKVKIARIIGLMLIILGAFTNGINSVIEKKENDSLKQQLNNLTRGVNSANENLLGLQKSDIKIFKNQVESFKTTAEKIQISADTLKKYLMGTDGIAYVLPDSFNVLSVINPNKYTLNQFKLRIFKYDEYLSKIHSNGVRRYINRNDLLGIRLIEGTDNFLRAGKSPIILKFDSSANNKFLITYNIGEKIYYQMLYVTKFGYFTRYYEDINQSGKLKMLWQKPEKIDEDKWRATFQGTIENVTLNF